MPTVHTGPFDVIDLDRGGDALFLHDALHSRAVVPSPPGAAGAMISTGVSVKPSTVHCAWAGCRSGGPGDTGVEIAVTSNKVVASSRRAGSASSLLSMPGRDDRRVINCTPVRRWILHDADHTHEMQAGFVALCTR